MTTLFNLFCPMFLSIKNVSYSVLLFMVLAISVVWLFMELYSLLNNKLNPQSLFPSDITSTMLYYAFFMLICMFNMISLMTYSFPITTVLMFNLNMSLGLWLGSILLLFLKNNSMKSFLPSNTPWYLVPFLSMVELVSSLVRPITLSFRLMANMCAGHILLTLMLKLTYNMWMISFLFNILELMVCVVQAYVFSMLVSVYFMEAK